VGLRLGKNESIFRNIYTLKPKPKISKKQIVCLDGYMEDGHNHTDVLIDCDAWRDDDLDTKRLVVICAMPCPQNASSIEDMLNKVELFKVHFGKKKSTMKPSKSRLLQQYQDCIGR
jgi:hypothetical protein